jgi:hypothetical protein
MRMGSVNMVKLVGILAVVWDVEMIIEKQVLNVLGVLCLWFVCGSVPASMANLLDSTSR